MSTGRFQMKRALSGVLAALLAASATAACAQSKPPLKLGGILDMSGLYADITGAGSETAAKMAAEDFGGEVLGRVRHPLNTSDFSSFLLQAQSSKAKVVGLANAGGDTINAIKQAAEFGI